MIALMRASSTGANFKLRHYPNWIAQDKDGQIWQYESEPIMYDPYFGANSNSDWQLTFEGAVNPDWQNSKINLNTNSAYIDSGGILRKCELIPEMLKPQAD